MTEYKSKQIFTKTIEPEKPEDKELTLQEAFKESARFVPAEVEAESEAEAEIQLEKTIRPSGKRRWLAGGLLTAFSGLVAWQAVDSVVTALATGDWLTVGWSAFIASIAGLGVTAIGRELIKLRRLRNHFSVHEEGEALLKSDGLGKGEAFCNKIAKESGVTEENPHYARWKNAIESSHSDSEVLQMYEAMVVTKQDQQAKKIVAQLASEAGMLVAVSPLAIADILLVAWRSFKMLDQLSDIYGVELGYWSRLQLFRLVLVNMAAAGASEVAADASMDLLSMDLAGKVSTRVAQGFGVGILTARLGLKAISLLRPVPWTSESRVRLGEIRKALLVKLKETL